MPSKYTATSVRVLESPYHTALCVELARRGIAFERGRVIPLEYHGVEIGEYIPDLIVENTVVVEIKSVLRFEDVFTAQMLTYLRLTKLRVGLIIISVGSVSSVVNVRERVSAPASLGQWHSAR